MLPLAHCRVGCSCYCPRMITFDLVPRVGLGPVRLSATREVIRQTLERLGFGVTHSRDNLDYFCGNALQVECGKDGCADFIGIAGSDDLCVTYFGIDVFDTPADRLFNAMAGRETSGSHTYARTEYLFPQQIVTLWDAAAQYDHRGGGRWPVWGQIGVGSERYLQSQIARAARR